MLIIIAVAICAIFAIWQHEGEDDELLEDERPFLSLVVAVMAIVMCLLLKIGSLP